MERNRLNAVLLKILDVYSLNNLAKIKKAAVTHLYSTVELGGTYHFVGKEKVANNIF